MTDHTRTFRAFAVATACLWASSTAAADSTSTTVESPFGLVTTTVTKVDPIRQTIAPAPSADVDRFNALAKQAQDFLAVYVPGFGTAMLQDFDAAVSLWRKEKPARYSAEQVVEMLGAYLGNRLSSDFSMTWVVVTDKEGTNYALWNKPSQTLAFPFASIKDRLDNGQINFMSGVYRTVRIQMEASTPPRE
jgi:hypothetical protein